MKVIFSHGSLGICIQGKNRDIDKFHVYIQTDINFLAHKMNERFQKRGSF